MPGGSTIPLLFELAGRRQLVAAASICAAAALR
jgi:hypothetical protein